jgi:ribosome-interacting GTPase 1
MYTLQNFFSSGLPNRLNKTPPNIAFRKKEKGGINFQTTVRSSQLRN